MDPSGRSQTIDEIFAAALEREPAERSAFLDSVCGDDSELRRVLESLLAHASRGSAPEAPTVALPRRKAPEREAASLVGQRLGRFEVLSKLGEGGMGEVYLARDSTLERRVAIKILPPHLADDAERIHRFRREAVAVSALNHPNILTVYEISAIDGRELLVSELVEGVTLREKLRKGALSVAAALDVAAQMARGLAAAHRVGIVHRDIKPENVMIRHDGLVKVLDFGLAKSLARPADSDEVPQFPTEAGTILGTVSYMSPERARGEAATRQSDVWALGCVLFESLTGGRPFTGRSMGDVLAAILTREADWDELPAEVPPQVRSLLRRCLAKDLDDRLQDIGDARLEIEEALRDPWVVEPALTGRRRWRAWGAAVLALAATVLVVALTLGPSGEPMASPPVSFELPHPTGGGFLFHVELVTLALSPDGSRLGFITLAPLGPSTVVWIRPLAELEARPLPGTEQAESLFWSPDGRDLGFVADGKLKRVPVTGGAPLALCEVEKGSGVNGTWGRDSILFASVQGEVIYRVPVAGGTPEVVMRVDPTRDERRLVWPWFLPDGERFLYLALHGDGSSELRLADGRGGSRGVASVASRVELVDPDIAVLARDGGLVAQRLDADRAALVGAPRPLAPVVRNFASTGWAAFATARRGALVLATQNDLNRLTLFDAAGRIEGTLGEPTSGVSVAVSPDGRRAILDRLRPGLATYDLWMFDLERGVESRFTDGLGTEVYALWLPGGRSVIYSSTRGRAPNLLRRDLATGKDEELVPLGPFQIVAAVTSDSRRMLYRQRTPDGFELLSASLEGDGNPTPVLRAGEIVADATLSPDGRVLAYTRIESGRPELFVRLLEGGESIRVSENGAWSTCFAPDGQTLFFTTGDHRVAAVSVGPGPRLSVGTPAVRFDQTGLGWMDFAVLPDGRFLALVRETDGTKAPLTVMTGWTSSGNG